MWKKILNLLLSMLLGLFLGFGAVLVTVLLFQSASLWLSFALLMVALVSFWYLQNEAYENGYVDGKTHLVRAGMTWDDLKAKAKDVIESVAHKEPEAAGQTA